MIAMKISTPKYRVCLKVEKICDTGSCYFYPYQIYTFPSSTVNMTFGEDYLNGCKALNKHLMPIDRGYYWRFNNGVLAAGWVFIKYAKAEN